MQQFHTIPVNDLVVVTLIRNIDGKKDEEITFSIVPLKNHNGFTVFIREQTEDAVIINDATEEEYQHACGRFYTKD